jgi:vacuolar protein sorting-associated protein VTA1
MPLAIPPELKKITPFIRRAEELDRDTTSPESRLVAYYCRQYAVHIGIPLTGSSAAAKACLGHLLGSLEQEKPAMDNFTRDESTFLCRKFANQVFDRTDAEDREGRADKNTAKAFYAAATFFEILQQFTDENDTSEEVAEDKRRILYTKWKATEILKAIKEGRQPQPGGYGEETEGDIIVGSEETKNKLDAPTAVVTITDDDDESVELVKPRKDTPISPSIYPLTPMPPPQMPQHINGSHEGMSEEGTEVELGPPPAYPGEVINDHKPQVSSSGPKLTFDLPAPVEARKLPPINTPTVKSPNQELTKATIGNLFGFAKKTGGKASKAQITDAVELTKFALAALEEKDGDMAADRLMQALQALGR